jgi:hypothetical protein
MASARLKEAGNLFLGVVGLLAMVAIPIALLWGAEWLSVRLLPWFVLGSLLAFGFLLLVVLPLSIFKACRGFAAVAGLIVSYVFGATAWMWGLLLTLQLWGWWAVIGGLLMMGVGVVPIAMLATLFKGMWSVLGQLVLLTVLTFGVRGYAAWIAPDSDSQPEGEAA